MIRTRVFRATQPKSELDALNLESGRLYTLTMAWHWRIYRRHGKWIAQRQAERLNDSLHGGTILHAHSCDAAQQAFYKACKTARTNRREDGSVRFPHRRKRYRTTVWKNTGIRLRDGIAFLARARGLSPVQVRIPFVIVEGSKILETRLVFNLKRSFYEWHMVIDDGLAMPLIPGTHIAGVDMGEIHPAVISTYEDAAIVSARELRATIQWRNKKQAEIKALQSRCTRRSRMWKRLQKRWNEIRATIDRKIRDICHKVSHAVIDWAVNHGVGLLVIGDVRDIGDGKRLRRKSQQKVSQWVHGMIRRFITYKAEYAGIRVELQDERYTSQTCPRCGAKHKQRGRVYSCRTCEFVGHRDVVGGAGIRTAYMFGSPGGAYPERIQVVRPFKGSRPLPSRPVDTGHVAGKQMSLFPEAAGF
jgi:putative transposase